MPKDKFTIKHRKGNTYEWYQACDPKSGLPFDTFGTKEEAEAYCRGRRDEAESQPPRMKRKKLYGRFVNAGWGSGLVFAYLGFHKYNSGKGGISTNNYANKANAKKAAIKIAACFGVDPENIEWREE